MSAFPRIAATATAVPPRRWLQEEIYELAARCFPSYRDRVVERIFTRGGIEARHLAFGPDEFDPQASADALHRRFAEHALPLAVEAARRALDAAGLRPRDVDCLVIATCTGYLCPGLSALVAREMEMRDDLQRTDQVGMGCAGAMPALQRASDHARAHPERVALAVAVEICSACWFVDDDLETAVGNALCGDGAAASVVVGAAHPTAGPGPELLRFETLLEPAMLDAVGFRFEGGKLRIVLSKELRSAAGPLVRSAVERLLERADLARSDVGRWVVHSGGRSVLDGIDEALGFGGDELEHSRAVLREHGNMSSPTVMFVLDRSARLAPPARGELGLMLALGPGLAAESALLRW